MQNKNLSVIAYANGATIWHYVDRKLEYSEIDLSNFFNSVFSLCAVGDKFMFNCKDAYFEAIVVKIQGEHVICQEILKLEYPKSDEVDND